MKLSTIFPVDSIKVQLEGLDKEEVIEELVDLLVRNGRLQDREAALETINAREAKGSTGIGNGVALPHGKTAAVNQLTGALGISREGVEFDSVDGALVQAVFLILAEANNPGPHLECLAQISRSLTPGFFKRLVGCAGAEEVSEILKSEEE